MAVSDRATLLDASRVSGHNGGRRACGRTNRSATLERTELDLAAIKLAFAAELKVLEKLGQGGEGEVFLAELPRSEAEATRGAPAKRVALKLLKDARQPLKAALGLVHPRIVRVL